MTSAMGDNAAMDIQLNGQPHALPHPGTENRHPFAGVFGAGKGGVVAMIGGDQCNPPQRIDSRQQPGKRSQRIVFVIHQRQRGGVRMQGARIATAQQVPVIHQFGQRLEVGEGRDVIRGAGAGGRVQWRDCGHGCIGWRRWGASIRRGRGSGKVRCRSLRIRHRAQATASGRGADVVDVCPCAS